MYEKSLLHLLLLNAEVQKRQRDLKHLRSSNRYVYQLCSSSIQIFQLPSDWPCDALRLCIHLLISTQSTDLLHITPLIGQFMPISSSNSWFSTRDLFHQPICIYLWLWNLLRFGMWSVGSFRAGGLPGNCRIFWQSPCFICHSFLGERQRPSRLLTSNHALPNQFKGVGPHSMSHWVKRIIPWRMLPKILETSLFGIPGALACSKPFWVASSHSSNKAAWRHSSWRWMPSSTKACWYWCSL